MNPNSNQRAIVPLSQDEASPRQPRQPSNLQDLLRYSIEAGQNENQGEIDALQHPNSTVQSVDSERFEFLQNALKSISDDIEEIKRALRTLQSIDDIGPEGDISVYEEALDNISDYVGNLDVARDFYNIGGFTVIFPLLACCRASIRWRAATIYGECTQNNLFCQTKALEEKELLSKLLKMTDSDPDYSVRVKSLYAISSIVRGNSEGLNEFTKLDGFSVIMRAMQSDEEKLITKSSFFLRAICSSNPEVKDELCAVGFVEQLVGLIVTQEFRPKTEHLLLALDSLIRNHSTATNECRRLDFGLQSYLENIIDTNKDEDAFLEAVECAKEILTAIQCSETSEK